MVLMTGLMAEKPHTVGRPGVWTLVSVSADAKAVVQNYYNEGRVVDVRC